MLKRSLLCPTYHYAPTQIQSTDVLCIQRKRPAAAKTFTLVVLLMASVMAYAQGVDTKGGTPPGDGQQSGPTFPGITVTGCTMDGAVCGGFIRRGSVQSVDLPTSPDPGSATEIPSSGGPNLSGNIDSTQGGSGGGSIGSWELAGIMAQTRMDIADENLAANTRAGLGSVMLTAGLESGDPIAAVMGLIMMAGGSAAICPNPDIMCGVAMPPGGGGKVIPRIGKLGSWSSWPDFGRLSGAQLRGTVNSLMELKTGYTIWDQVPMGTTPEVRAIMNRAGESAIQSVRLNRWMDESRLFGTGGPLRMTPSELFKAIAKEDANMREIGDDLMHMPNYKPQ